MALTATDAQKIIGQVSALAIVDEEFKSRLTAAPVTILREHGLEMPDDMQVTILQSFDAIPVEAPEHMMYLVVPEAEELSHEELALVVGAAQSCQSTAGTCCTFLCVSSFSSASTNSCQ